MEHISITWLALELGTMGPNPNKDITEASISANPGQRARARRAESGRAELPEGGHVHHSALLCSQSAPLRTVGWDVIGSLKSFAPPPGATASRVGPASRPSKLTNTQLTVYVISFMNCLVTFTRLRSDEAETKATEEGVLILRRNV